MYTVCNIIFTTALCMLCYTLHIPNCCTSSIQSAEERSAGFRKKATSPKPPFLHPSFTPYFCTLWLLLSSACTLSPLLTSAPLSHSSPLHPLSTTHISTLLTYALLLLPPPLHYTLPSPCTSKHCIPCTTLSELNFLHTFRSHSFPLRTSGLVLLHSVYCAYLGKKIFKGSF